MCAHFFHWQILEDVVMKSYSTNECFTLQLISQASIATINVDIAL
jgi:hypothetical protein